MWGTTTSNTLAQARSEPSLAVMETGQSHNNLLQVSITFVSSIFSKGVEGNNSLVDFWLAQRGDLDVDVLWLKMPALLFLILSW